MANSRSSDVKWMLALIAVWGVALLAPSAPSAPTKKKVLVYKDIAPLLKTACGACHMRGKAPHGLDLKTYESLMKGDKGGKVVISGNPPKSRLAGVLHGKPQL